MAFPNPFSGPEIYVSPPPSGAEPGTAPEGSGTLADPYHSVSAGITAVDGGGTVFVRGGEYVESIDLTGISGTRWRKIVVRPYHFEQVTIDWTVRRFRGPVPNQDWEPVPGHSDEFISTDRFDRKPGRGSNVIDRGAFLDLERHTRLISYDRLEDLRSPNQLWPDPNQLALEQDLVGPGIAHEVLKEDGEPFNPRRFRPYVYMGPGIWFDEDEGEQGRRVHIRLSHTNNQVDGWPDYNGKTDPRQLPLALSQRESHVLRLVSCEHLRFQNLTLRFGGEDTIRLRNCCDVVFDHVRIWAGSRAIRLLNEGDNPEERNKAIEFRHCEIDGGLPTWFFRSDRKDDYRFRPAPGAPVTTNLLGHATSGVLLSSDSRAERISVHHCEIANGHDVYVAFGDQMRFHHNWVHNIDDDGLGVTIVNGTQNAWIYQNVVTQCLTALSFAGGTVGHVYVFRNLIDVRVATLGSRPRKEGEQRSLRQGEFYKDGENEGPVDLFHNTCTVLDPGGIGMNREEIVAAGFAHYRSLVGGAQRRAFNNIFMAVYSKPGEAKAIAFLPPHTFAGPTDGNTYCRYGSGDLAKFLVPVGDSDGFKAYLELGDYKLTEPPYEQHGQSEDPQFRSFDANGQPQPNDDLRLKEGSPARNSSVPLPHDLRWIDVQAGGLWSLLSRDRGCYRHRLDRMKVGVGGRRKFPPDE